MNKKAIKKYLDNPFRLFLRIGQGSFLRLVDDEPYLKFIYKGLTGKKLNLDCPKTFNEKLQWLKLYDRRPEYSVMVDKYLVKDYVAKIIGQQHIVPTLGVWNSFDEIDFDTLPDRFVLKCTHDSGGLVICRDKSRLNREAAREKINKCMKQEYYFRAREWPYKNVTPRIIAEAFLEKEDGSIPEDYKILTFNGTPRLIQVDLNRHTQHKKKFYSPDWEELDFDFNYPTDRTHPLAKPEHLAQMLQLAQILSKDIPFVRVDFYQVGDRIYFGELTFFPASGFGRFTPEEWDTRLGSWLTLPDQKTE